MPVKISREYEEAANNWVRKTTRDIKHLKAAVGGEDAAGQKDIKDLRRRIKRIEKKMDKVLVALLGDEGFVVLPILFGIMVGAGLVYSYYH